MISLNMRSMNLKCLGNTSSENRCADVNMSSNIATELHLLLPSIDILNHYKLCNPITAYLSSKLSLIQQVKIFV